MNANCKQRVSKANNIQQLKKYFKNLLALVSDLANSLKDIENARITNTYTKEWMLHTLQRKYQLFTKGVSQSQKADDYS